MMAKTVDNSMAQEDDKSMVGWVEFLFYSEHVDHDSMWKASIGSQEDVGHDALWLALLERGSASRRSRAVCVIVVREKPNLHLELYQLDVTDEMRSPWKLPVDVVSKGFQEMINIVQKLDNSMQLVTVGFQVGCFRGRRPRCIVAGLVNRGSAARSVHRQSG